VKVLVVDVGGNNVKLLVSGQRQVRKIPSGRSLTPRRMVASIRETTVGWRYDAVAIGFPGQIKKGRIVAEPMNLGRGWVGFDFRRAFRRPVRLINDAVMQALGSYRRGRMLFIGLGTGLGAALVIEGLPQPLEIAHLSYRDGFTYEDFLGKQGLDDVGKKLWRGMVFEIVPRLHEAFQVDEVVIGGGNAKLLARLPRGSRRGANRNAFAGGFRLFADRPPARRRPKPRRSTRRRRS
jgi:hypothetical protein